MGAWHAGVHGTRAHGQKRRDARPNHQPGPAAPPHRRAARLGSNLAAAAHAKSVAASPSARVRATAAGGGASAAGAPAAPPSVAASPSALPSAVSTRSVSSPCARRDRHGGTWHRTMAARRCGGAAVWRCGGAAV
eukprot:4115599-Prymnesium_polylepis.1